MAQFHARSLARGRTNIEPTEIIIIRFISNEFLVTNADVALQYIALVIALRRVAAVDDARLCVRQTQRQKRDGKSLLRVQGGEGRLSHPLSFPLIGERVIYPKCNRHFRVSIDRARDAEISREFYFVSILVPLYFLIRDWKS